MLTAILSQRLRHKEQPSSTPSSVSSNVTATQQKQWLEWKKAHTIQGPTKIHSVGMWCKHCMYNSSSEERDRETERDRERQRETHRESTHYSIHSILTYIIVHVTVCSIEWSTPTDLVLQLKHIKCTWSYIVLSIAIVNTHIVYSPVGVTICIGYDTIQNSSTLLINEIKL